jgi:hypothetical protein
MTALLSNPISRLAGGTFVLAILLAVDAYAQAVIGTSSVPVTAAGAAATADAANGITLENIYPATIVELKDGSLITEAGMRSTDGGRSWTKSDSFKPAGEMGILRLPNGELGAFSGNWTLEAALGNETNSWSFYWSADEGQTWSEPVQITLPGLTMALAGTMFALHDGKRICLVTYSQFLGSRFDKRGSSWGVFKGNRVQTETEAHYPQAEACRMYYSDDNGRSWQPSDGWIMGWRDERYTDLFTEGDAVELKDGRILMIGRSATGRVHQAFSDDRGHSWWPGGQPTELASSYSPARIRRLPTTGDLLIVWNQLSRQEIRKGFRRSRLSSAISSDEGKTWGHFKNLEALSCLASVTRVTPDEDLSPVWGDAEVGELPDDFATYDYPNMSIIGDKVFVSYGVQDVNGKGLTAGAKKMRILPTAWFYK